ncbi:hypothetical protein LUZ60_017513 [Juncus effusus]|nr:hypothetical protein LUZ60_017513 [Juncus effusus]
MDPSVFLRLLIFNLAVRLPLGASTAAIAIKEALSSASLYVRIKLADGRFSKCSPLHIAPCDAVGWFAAPKGPAVAFDFSKLELSRFAKGPVNLTLEVFACFDDCCPTVLPSSQDWVLGSTTMKVDLRNSMEERVTEHYSGWRDVEMKDGPCFSQLHVSVSTEKEERFVFKASRGPAASNSRVCHVQDSQRSRSLFSYLFSRDSVMKGRGKTGGLKLVKKWIKKKLGLADHKAEKQDCSVIVQDKSGSPAAIALMTEPFVPTLDTNSITSAKPGSWLILQPRNIGKWAAWGTLCAWTDPTEGSLTYRFERLMDSLDGIPVSYSSISRKDGGQFSIDLPTDRTRGFVMSASVKGEGKRKSPALNVEVAAKFVRSKEDLAAYMALAAALDLSVDACRACS